MQCGVGCWLNAVHVRNNISLDVVSTIHDVVLLANRYRFTDLPCNYGLCSDYYFMNAVVLEHQYFVGKNTLWSQFGQIVN